MASVFLSDIHLKPLNDPRTLVLCKYLDGLNQDIENVFLLGDIFDFWMGGHKIWQQRYKPLVESVKRLIDRNIKVYFFEGNHDIHVHPFWNKELGVEVITEARMMNLHGHKVRIEHGDLFNPDDKNYILFRNFLRSWPLKVSSINAPGALVAAIADWGSATSHKFSSKRGRDPAVIIDIKRRMREYVISCARQADFDIMIMGHTHIREDYYVDINDKKVRFINLGSWFEPNPKAFVLSQSSGFFQEIK